MQRLRAAGLRPTVARIGVLQVLLSSAPHALSRDEIYRQLYLRGTPVSVGTVMQVVAQLSRLGELLLIGIIDIVQMRHQVGAAGITQFGIFKQAYDLLK